MYKLLIVEDEKTIAQGIAHSIPWAEWGFQIAGICYNGAEAVDFVGRERPDLVLSDIRMPQMDGIALMQYLNQHYPDIKIIILSGYNDFEYLQMSIRNNVTEYLLKPTDVDEFEELFRRLKTTLDQETQSRQEQETMRLERDINALLKGYGYDEEKVEEQLFVEDTDRFGVFLFRIENGCQEDKNKFFSQQQEAVKVLNRYGAGDVPKYGGGLAESKLMGDRSENGTGPGETPDISGKIRRGRYLCNYEEEISGLFCVEEELEEEEFEEYALFLQERVHEETGLRLSCGISRFYGDYRMIPQCYEQTKCCISQSLFQSGIYFFHQLSDSNFDYYQVAFDEDRILKCILNQNSEDLEREIAAAFQNLNNRKVKDHDYVNRMGLEILFIISRKMLKYNVRPEQIMNDNGFTYAELTQRRTLEAKQHYLTGIFELFMKECASEQGRNSKTGELARVVRNIVDADYMSNLISLEYVAEKVRKNTAYISKIFKNEFECNFSTYITEKRLERSRELLENPVMKIYEISQQLGWADVSNYIKVFKKKYGISPDEYRRISVK